VLVDKISHTDYQVYSMDINPDETKLVAAGLYTPDEKNNYIEVYDLNNMKAAPKKIYGFSGSVENVHFTADGKGIFVRDNGGHSIKYCDLTTVKEVIKSPVKINAIDLSFDGSKIAGAGDNGILYIWDATNNFSVSMININEKTHLMAVTWHPTSNQVIVGDSDGLLRILNGNTVIRTLSGHEGPIEQIKYNHAANFFASASKDRSVRLWNLNKLNEQPIQLKGHGDWVWSIAFTPNDEQVLVGLQSTRQVVKGAGIQNEESIWAYPTKIPTMANILCEEFIKRNLTKTEWEIYVGDDLPYENTCSNKAANDK
jgi:WD40 repeat protein